MLCTSVALVGDSAKCVVFYFCLNYMQVVSLYTLKLSDILYFTGEANAAGCRLWDEVHIICCK